MSMITVSLNKLVTQFKLILFIYEVKIHCHLKMIGNSHFEYTN